MRQFRMKRNGREVPQAEESAQPTTGPVRGSSRLGGASLNGEEGLSAIEIVLIALAGLILIGGALYYFTVFRADNDMNDALSDVSTVAGNVQSWYSGQGGNFAGLSNTAGISANVFPQSMVNGANVTDPWGGAVTLQADASQGFDVIFANVPADACNHLGTERLGSLLSVTINGTNMTPPNNTPAAVAGACTAGGNTIQWQFNG